MKLQQTIRQLLKYFVLCFVGGFIYYIIEFIFKHIVNNSGITHWSMFVIGGICFVIAGSINNVFSFDMPLWKQLLISATLITVVEFIFGLILNVWLGLGIWDYSNHWGNILGQICPKWFFVWYFLSLPCIFLADWLDYKWFDGEKPYYVMFGM